ncbi:cystathionine beta-synthase isoform X1 [Tribolium madens]|uniref:cystathionine beta-synthase isoform X1 n=1 Tax=Tribolium madens TaxID=41895 RepID=UPI001CF755AE|nr:cystathionine beta-synthase isoform X1 [Tribolium madens]
MAGVINGKGQKPVQCKKTGLKFISNLNVNFATPDQPPKCTWHKGVDPDSTPHRRTEWRTQEKIYSDVTKAVGNTPLVRLNKITKTYGLECEILAKCEYFNPGGSVKDRIGFRMIEDAEEAGILKPGSTIIEPTSGNTGIGLALGAAVKGYRCIIVMSEKMSNEKVDVLKALGAEIVRTPITADSNSPEGLFGVSHRLKKEIPNSIILDQYSNPGNPLAHYDTTAEEILDQCGGKVDMIVVGTGTGGTITGIGKKFKEASPSTIIVGADPVGSILAQPEELNQTDSDFYEVEGIGYDFIPTGFDRSVVDHWVKVNDQEALPMARKLIKEEGLLCGGSAGAVVAAAVKAGRDLKKGQRIVVIIPDSIRNYITKFVSDHWMESKGFKECENPNNHWWWDQSVANFTLEPLITATSSMTCERIMHVMKKQGIDQVPIVDKNGFRGILSMVTMQKILNVLISGNVKPSDSIDKASVTVFPKVFKNTSLGLVSRVLERENYVLVLEKQNTGQSTIEKPVGIITAVDLLHYISSNTPK